MLSISVFFNAQAQKKKKLKGKDEIAIVSTDFGEIVFLLSDKTPEHKENFIKLAKEGFYDGTIFHRVLKGFMIQGGDPNTRTDGDSTRIGIGSPGYTLNSEFTDELKFDYGTIGMARQSDEINPSKSSSGSQFFIIVSRDGAYHLDSDYTVFGRVIKGMEVAEKIADLEINSDAIPLKRHEINIKVVKLKKKDIVKTYELDNF
ncbi:peptidylprolyl isomerase [Flammeovirga yaeyamensis]|nr:peptidylprolyl isomerase [Flammeovirga yaeyamensis]